MRHFLLVLLLGVSFASASQNISILSQSITTPAPTSCSNTFLSVSTQEACLNYTYTGSTVTISGNTVTVQLDWTEGPICLGAINFGTYSVNLGVLPSGINSVTTSTYLNGVLSASSGPLNVSVVSCCGATASFTQSASEVCVGDSLFFSSTSTNADSVRWFADGVFVDTVSNLGISFNSAGAVDISIVAYSDTCNDTSSASITVNPLPQFSLGNDTAICSNDQLELSVLGFSSYAWSDGSILNNSMIDSVGFIWLEVTDANGCVSSDTLSVTSLIPLTDVDLGLDIDKCPEAQETLFASASHASYLWSNGSTAASITAAQPGVYWLEATDNGFCHGRDTVLVANYQVDEIQFVEDSNKCGVNTMTLSSNYFVYNWSNGSTQSSANILVNSTVGVSVTDGNGCFQEDSTEVEVFDVPNVDLGEDTYLCGTQGVTLTSNVSGQYLWSTGSQAAVVLLTQVGQYWLEVTNEDGCAGRDTVLVQQCLGVQEFDSEVKIYPNPVNTVLNIEVLSNSIGQSCTIYNAQGIEVGKSNLTNQQNTVDVSQLANGIYFLEIGKDKLSTPIIISR